jgi:hypothetical protein
MANNRLLKNTTLSEKVNMLSFQAEVLFYRLIMVADDWGGFFATPKIVKANCFPLKTDTIRDADIARWIDEIEKAGVIVVYTVADKDYLRIVDFGQRLRTKRSKYPEPPTDLLTIDSNVRTNDGELQQSAADCSNVSLKYEEKYEEKREENSGRAPELSMSNLFRKPFIPTEDQVKEAFVLRGGTIEQAEKFFNKHQATGWFIQGSPITSYTSLIPGFISAWKGRDGGSNSGEKRMVW